MRRLLSTSLSSRVLWRPRPVARACVGSRGLCSSGSDATLPALLEQHGLPAEAVPADADHEIVARNLRLLKALNVPDVPAAVSLEPELMSRDLVAYAPPRIEYLTSLGVSSIGDMVRHHPRLLWCDITRDLHRKVAILQALGVRKIAWWLQKNSRVLAVDVERDMRPPIELLRTVPGAHTAARARRRRARARASRRFRIVCTHCCCASGGWLHAAPPPCPPPPRRPAPPPPPRVGSPAHALIKTRAGRDAYAWRTERRSCSRL